MKNLADQLRNIPALQNDIKLMRGVAHAAFDRIWKEGWMSRTKAYHWLADQMSLRPCQAHIANFNEEQCKFVVSLAQQYIDEAHR